MSVVQLPIIVNGRRVDVDADRCHRIGYDTGCEVLIPRLDDPLVEEILAAPRAALAHVHLDDITIALSAVGKAWSDPRYPLRAEATRLAARVTGYSEEIIQEDHTRIARTLSRAKLYDIVDADLDDGLVLDDWIPRRSVYVKATPKGRVLHVMVGNVPLAGLFTLVRSLLTKNTTVAKLPSRDPVSCLYFALAFLDVAAAAPLAAAMSVAYWPGGDEVETRFIAASDVVVAWGQAASIAAVKRRVPAGVEVLEFGPKESLHLIREPFGDLDNLAMRAAYDISVYDQEACFSPQRMFVQGDVERFTDALAVWLGKMVSRLPVSFRTIDQRAHRTRAHRDAQFEGCTVRTAANGEWMIITVPAGTREVFEHPLSRTIYVHPVDDLRDAVAAVHREVQTVGVHPWSAGQELADDLAAAGADRITEVGLMSRPRPGFTHDALQPLRHLVRWVTLERGLEYKGRFRDTERDEFEHRVFRPGAP